VPTEPMRVACPACGTCFGVTPKKKVDVEGVPAEWHWEAEIVGTPEAGLFNKVSIPVTRVAAGHVELDSGETDPPDGAGE
jgi:hypothetical protein